MVNHISRNENRPGVDVLKYCLFIFYILYVYLLLKWDYRYTPYGIFNDERMIPGSATEQKWPLAKNYEVEKISNENHVTCSLFLQENKMFFREKYGGKLLNSSNSSVSIGDFQCFVHFFHKINLNDLGMSKFKNNEGKVTIMSWLDSHIYWKQIYWIVIWIVGINKDFMFAELTRK